MLFGVGEVLRQLRRFGAKYVSRALRWKMVYKLNINAALFNCGAHDFLWCAKLWMARAN